MNLRMLEQSQQAEQFQDKSKKQMEMATWMSQDIRINVSKWGIIYL